MAAGFAKQLFDRDVQSPQAMGDLFSADDYPVPAAHARLEGEAQFIFAQRDVLIERASYVDEKPTTAVIGR